MTTRVRADRRPRSPLAPAFVVTLSAAMVAAACSDGVAQAGSSDGPGQGGTGGSSGSGSPLGGAAGMVNQVDCPRLPPRMDDPCAPDARVCTYGTGCKTIATCKVGRWKLERNVSGTGSCNPPVPCPDDEPADVENASCDANFLGGPSYCRYARGGCFAYLSCLQNDTPSGRWRPGSAFEDTSDGCCPAAPPPVGEPCAQPGLLCPGTSADVLCRDGQWLERRPPAQAP